MLLSMASCESSMLRWVALVLQLIRTWNTAGPFLERWQEAAYCITRMVVLWMTWNCRRQRAAS